MIDDSSLTPGIAAALNRSREVALQFDLPVPLEVCDFAGKGNINQQTYLVKAGHPGNRTEYLLQMLNPVVFSQPRIVMNAMILCIQAQERALLHGMLRNDEEWETIRLVPTKTGSAYLEIMDEGGMQCWRMMTRISHAQTYKSLREIPDSSARLRIAEEAGRGLALFGILTSGMDASQIGCPLPGYRDTGLYYDQLVSVLEGNRTLREAAKHLPADPAVRQSTEPHFLIHIGPEEYRRRLEDPLLDRFIALALEQRSFALTLVTGLMAGDLKKVVVHGDTKLENFLFSTSTRKVKALVDLDTIMPHTWLTDWGDMVRSLVNIAGERETDLETIDVDLEVFKAAARGFLRSMRGVAMREIELLADAPQIMALELGVRFLTDYLRGDSYFKLGAADPPDLNRTRALVQFCLYEKLRRHAASVKQYIEEILRQSP